MNQVPLEVDLSCEPTNNRTHSCVFISKIKREKKLGIIIAWKRGGMFASSLIVLALLVIGCDAACRGPARFSRSPKPINARQLTAYLSHNAPQNAA